MGAKKFLTSDALFRCGCFSCVYSLSPSNLALQIYKKWWNIGLKDANLSIYNQTGLSLNAGCKNWQLVYTYPKKAIDWKFVSITATKFSSFTALISTTLHASLVVCQLQFLPHKQPWSCEMFKVPANPILCELNFPLKNRQLTQGVTRTKLVKGRTGGTTRRHVLLQRQTHWHLILAMLCLFISTETWLW